jgi:hypothetical protein
MSADPSYDERIVRLLGGLGQLMAEAAGNDQPLSDELLAAFDQLVIVATGLIQGDAVGARHASERLDDIVARLDP